MSKTTDALDILGGGFVNMVSSFLTSRTTWLMAVGYGVVWSSAGMIAANEQLLAYLGLTGVWVGKMGFQNVSGIIKNGGNGKAKPDTIVVAQGDIHAGLPNDWDNAAILPDETTPEPKYTQPEPAAGADSYDWEAFEKRIKAYALSSYMEENPITLFQSVQGLGPTFMGKSPEIIQRYNAVVSVYADEAFTEKFGFNYEDFNDHVKEEKGNGKCKSGWSPASAALVWGDDYYTLFLKVSHAFAMVGRPSWPTR